MQDKTGLVKEKWRNIEMARCEMCGTSLTWSLVRFNVPDFDGNSHLVCGSCNARAQGKDLKYDPQIGKVIICELEDLEVRKVSQTENDSADEQPSVIERGNQYQQYLNRQFPVKDIIREDTTDREEQVWQENLQELPQKLECDAIFCELPEKKVDQYYFFSEM